MKHACAGLIAIAVLGGCAATNPPLMFGDTTTFGLRLGNDTASGGGSVALGFKALSVAIVPVSVLDENGKPWLLRGKTDRSLGALPRADAMSVFASFESESRDQGAQSRSVELGQVFSTGMAAQALTSGYLCKALADASCSSLPSPEQLQSVADLRRETTTMMAAAAEARSAVQRLNRILADGAMPSPRSDDGDTAVSAVVASDRRPYQAPLVFLRTDQLGIGIGGSLAEQGLAFDLGFTNRNLALVPVYAEGGDGKVVRIVASEDEGDAKDPKALDAMSVLGQFKADSRTSGLGFGLGRYFSTGVAARNLGSSIAATISKSTAPSSETPAAAAVTAATLR